MNGFDRLFWRRLWAIGRPFWVSDQKWVPLGLLGVSLLLTGSIKTANVVFSYVNRDMMTALTDREAVFFRNMWLTVAYSLTAAPITAVDGYVQARLMIRWRQWLAESFLDRSFRDRIFYRISQDPRIDNPDQRISEDLNAFPGFVVSLVLQTLWGIVTGVSFVVVLWLISPSPRASNVTDAELVAVLERVGLADLRARVGGLDAEHKWKDLLSLGEQQTIAFARLLLDRPACAFLDEATSALDAAHETALYQRVVATNVQLVSTRTRPGLAEFHDVLLELLGAGAWRISRPRRAPG